ncbi:MAG: imidazole glycerol phosphate synthase subunit HisF [Bacteroidia bacterium]|nr:imidazole glycerol phosphate synthase subunit HisF [Bacteroidia bacterium]
MLKKRIIPCLDIKEGRTVKGINFGSIKDAGDPVELAKTYVEHDADELVFLDITATIEERKTLIDLVERIAREINIPFTVGGGINTVQDVDRLIKAGADKISINSSAVKRPNLIKEIAQQYGSQCVVVAIDAKWHQDTWNVFIHGGTTPTPYGVLSWAKQVEQLGAGEILLTSMNQDGTKAGFALELVQQVADEVNIPVIASGGAGVKSHFKDVFEKTGATAALAASIFHYGEVSIPDLKKYLVTHNVAVRTSKPNMI